MLDPLTCPGHARAATGPDVEAMLEAHTRKNCLQWTDNVCRGLVEEGSIDPKALFLAVHGAFHLGYQLGLDRGGQELMTIEPGARSTSTLLDPTGRPVVPHLRRGRDGDDE